MSLKQHLREDEADESRDVKKYGERAEEAAEHPQTRSMLKGIQSDEKRHNRTLAKHRVRISRQSSDRKSGR